MSHEVDFDRLDELPQERSVPFTDVDLSSDGKVFRGYAATFDEVTDLGMFSESVARGAFRKALASGQNVPMLWHHNDQLPPVATTGGKTLRLKEDGKGLLVEADIAKHFVGDAIREMVERGDVRGMSFGFIAGRGNTRLDTSRAKPHRELLNFKRLLDVSPTHEPAYAGTDAGFRSLARTLQMAESLDDVQHALMGAYPQLESRAVVEPGTEEEEATEPNAETGVEAEGPETEESQAEVEPESEVEQPSGAEPVDETAFAARKRRLQMLGLTLPR